MFWRRNGAVIVLGAIAKANAPYSPADAAAAASRRPDLMSDGASATGPSLIGLLGGGGGLRFRRGGGA